MTVQELEKRGVDVLNITKKTNLLFLLADLIESVSREIKDELKSKEVFRFEVKMHIDKLLHHSSALVRLVDTTVDGNTAEQFGDDADNLRNILYSKLGLK